MGILSTLFPGPAAIGKVVETGAGLLDKAFYTQQEQAEDAAKARAALADQYIRWLEATQGSAVARRLIALIIVSLWSTTWLAALLCEVAAPWVAPDVVPQLRTSGEALRAAAGEMNTPLGLVLAFYFTMRGISYIGDAVSKAKGHAQ